MEVLTDRINGLLTVSVDGRLDAFGSSRLDEVLKSVISDSDSYLVIDMERTPYLSSGGIRVMVAAQKMLVKRVQ